MPRKLRVLVLDLVWDSEFLKKVTGKLLDSGFIVYDARNAEFFKENIGLTPKKYDVAVLINVEGCESGIKAVPGETIDIFEVYMSGKSLGKLIGELRKMKA